MRKYLYLLFLLLSFVNAEAINVNEFEKILIQEEGRVKPLLAYAQGQVLSWRSRKTVNDEDAASFLARLWFDSQSTLSDPLFRVELPELIRSLGIEVRERHRYSFSDFNAKLGRIDSMALAAEGIAEEERSLQEKEIISLKYKLQNYLESIETLSFTDKRSALSLSSSFYAKRLGIKANEAYSYYEWIQIVHKLEEEIRPLLQLELDALSEDQVALFQLYRNLMLFADRYHSQGGRLLPKEGTWEKPWAVVTDREQYKTQSNALYYLQSLQRAYSSKDQQSFNEYARAFATFQTKAYAPDDGEKIASKVSAEIFYLKAEFIANTKWALFFLSLISIFLSIVKRKTFYALIWALTLAVGLYLSVGIALRMYILDRPPITNLFETFLFVAWSCIILGFFIEHFTRNGLGLFSANLAALILLQVGSRFGTDGDSLQVVVAVLDSNFWLSTHVIAVNLGYGGIIFSGLLAHFYFIELLKKDPERRKLNQIFKLVYAVQAFGLLFTFVGTILGGIWADQSWGRFWGWDPKENGALLIVLWSAILFHARLGNIVHELGFALGAILNIIVVLFAWFGINLLGVGLHSYGFIDGVFLNLIIYSIVQILALVSLYVFIIIKHKNKAYVRL